MYTLGKERISGTLHELSAQACQVKQHEKLIEVVKMALEILREDDHIFEV